MDSPLLMTPRMRFQYRVEHDANKGRRGEQLHSVRIFAFFPTP